MTPPTRREVLSSSVALLPFSLAGCADSESSRSSASTATGPSTPSRTTEHTRSTTHEPTRTITPLDDGDASPSRSCSGEYDAVDPAWVVAGPGPIGGFELFIRKAPATRGDVFEAEVLNVRQNRADIGIKGKFDVQYRGSTGWHSVLAADSAWNDLAYRFEPGEGHTWKFPFTEEGIRDASERPEYLVCDELSAGEYRFVYWGVTGRREVNENFSTDYALGRSFELSSSGTS